MGALPTDWDEACNVELHVYAYSKPALCGICYTHSLIIFAFVYTHIQLEDASEYEERQKIRKAIRSILKAEGRATTKKTGTAEYRRMGTFQAPKQITIPNSVTGNVLPDRMVVGSNKMERVEGGKTISYLNAKTTQPPRGYTPKNTREKSGGPIASAKIPVGRESPSSYRRRSPLNSSGQSPVTSPRPSVSSTQSITPEPPKVREGERNTI